MSKGYSGHFEGTKGANLFPSVNKQAYKFDSNGYNDADSDLVRKVNIINEFDITGHKTTPTKGIPNSVTKIIDKGEFIRERYYDENGDVYLDIDYTNHGNSKTHPNVPHQHRWIKNEIGTPVREHNNEEIIRRMGWR